MPHAPAGCSKFMPHHTLFAGTVEQEKYSDAQPPAPNTPPPAPKVSPPASKASNCEGEDVALPAQLSLKGAQITLFEFSLSPPCAKVRALLHFYRIPYTSSVTLPNAKKEGLDPSYGKVPRLLIDGIQINDSEVIFRALSPLLAGAPLTPSQAALEKDNNIRGLMGALERESFGSFFGIAGAASAGLDAMLPTWQASPLWSYVGKPAIAFSAGLLWPVPYAVLGRVTPHGAAGDSLKFGHRFRGALGLGPFFHGSSIGPLDLSLYGTLKSFVHMASPVSSGHLNRSRAESIRLGCRRIPRRWNRCVAARSQLPDPNCRIPTTGSQLPDPDYRVLTAGS